MERKEAIEVIKKNWPDNNFTMLCEALETLIPELKESEDEKIRELLINLANQTWDGADCFKDFSKEKILAWLQKQGEPTDINPSEFDLRLNKLLKQFETLSKEELASSLSFYLNVVQNDGTYKAEEKQGEQKLLNNDKYQTVSVEILDRLYESEKELEQLKQREQKPANNILEAWKDMRLEVYQQASGNRHESNYSDDATKMFSLNDIDEIIEKMSEQKPIDKVEPKFKKE